MKTTAILASAASILSLSGARINGFTVPATIAPGSDVKITITTEGYIQSIQDVGVSFGVSPEKTFYPGALGTLLSTKFLGPKLSNTRKNITHHVHIPSTQEPGPYVLQAAAFQLTGVSTNPTYTIYSANVTVGKSTSKHLVASKFVKNACQTSA